MVVVFVTILNHSFIQLSYFTRIGSITLSLIRNEKPIVLFKRHCHATEKSEAGCMCQSSWLTGGGPQKNNWKMEGQGGGRQKGDADPPPPPHEKWQVFFGLKFAPTIFSPFHVGAETWPFKLTGKPKWLNKSWKILIINNTGKLREDLRNG
jgi:hypothetical protein